MTEGTLVSRRDLIKLGSAALVSAAAGHLLPEAIQNFEKRDADRLQDIIRETGGKKLTELEKSEIDALVNLSAKLYTELTGIDVDKEHLVSITSVYNNEDEFIQGVRNSGYPDYSPDRNNLPWGKALGADNPDIPNTAHINLVDMEKDMKTSTRYTAVGLVYNLFHEWTHCLATINTRGEILKSGVDYFIHQSETESEVKEPWQKYVGGRVYSVNNMGYNLFDEAWTDLIARMAINETLDDPELKNAATNIMSTSRYAERVRMLSRVAEDVRYEEESKTSNGQEPPLDLKQLAMLHRNSDFETFLQRIGRAYPRADLSLLSDRQLGEREDDQILKDRDFLIGKRIAVQIEFANPTTLSQVLDTLE
ncbi:hypothetical protein IPM62_01400 [Candidatus Woesebacteria bacterium]|nr:MAG: hypothetical protein IPM62_01400 [Candidatus Woesebacteria bacterium]